MNQVGIGSIAETESAFIANLTLAAGNYENLDIRNYILTNTKWDGSRRIRCTITIPNTVVIGSRDITKVALTYTSFNKDDYIVVTNNGSIIGAGGAAGASGGVGAGNVGGYGGTACFISGYARFVNNGNIFGGGGGGGAGGGYYQYATKNCNGYNCNCYTAYGDCRLGNSNGTGVKCGDQQFKLQKYYHTSWLVCSTCYSQCDDSYRGGGGSGGPGRGYNNYNSWNGAGSTGSINSRTIPGGAGGDGGDYGASGGTGITSTYGGAYGGSAGNSVIKNTPLTITFTDNTGGAGIKGAIS
jgi:hypothetical protein